jgi:hypothetical protein
MLIGGRNLGVSGGPAVRFTVAIDGVPLETWETAPGFFLHVFDVPAGRLEGESGLARLTVWSTPSAGADPVPTAIEQFDLQNLDTMMWGYAEGWLEAEYAPALGVWRWTSDRATLRIVGPEGPIRATFSIEAPLRYFDDAPRVRVSAGARELAISSIANSVNWTIDVPADALRAADGRLTIETDRTFVPADRGGPPDHRRLGLRIFGLRLLNSLTPAEANR